MKSSLENAATGRIDNAIGSLPMISAHPVREGTHVRSLVSVQRSLRGALRKSRIDRWNEADLEGNRGKVLCFDRNARSLRGGHRRAKAAGGARVALGAIVMARRRRGAGVVMVGARIAGCVMRVSRTLLHQHCLVIVARGRRAGGCYGSSRYLNRRAKQHRCGSEALEGHRQQHEPHDQRFQQYFHDDNSSILKKTGCRRCLRGARVEFDRW